MKIGLGTVQFGLNYGISNNEGQTSPVEVLKILDVAKDQRISVIDTAALYGSSEEVLGDSLPADNAFRVVTKTIRIDSGTITAADADRLEHALSASFDKLRCKSVYAVMFHNADDLLASGGEMLMERLLRQKEKGRLAKIGASVYAAAQIDKILDRYQIDVIQLPVNVMDQRLIAGGHLAALKSRGVEVHARSAFLQGLLLMRPESLPGFFDPVRKQLEEFHRFARGHGLTPVRAALGFLSARPEIDSIVCGVNNHKQLLELCQASEPLLDIDFSHFACQNVKVLDPSQWQTA